MLIAIIDPIKSIFLIIIKINLKINSVLKSSRLECMFFIYNLNENLEKKNVSTKIVYRKKMGNKWDIYNQKYFSHK